MSNTLFQSLYSFGLGAAGALGTAIQAGQISELSDKVESLERSVSELNKLMTQTINSVTSICTLVSWKYFYPKQLACNTNSYFQCTEYGEFQKWILNMGSTDIILCSLEWMNLFLIASKIHSICYKNRIWILIND